MKTLCVEITWLPTAENIIIVPGETFTSRDLISKVSSHSRLSCDNFYLVQNGRLLERENVSDEYPVRALLKVLGGKGGFGSMLRAIGAQIEKTTNREACRDLSGRRLRDINEEKRLKTWIGQQADRERQEAERKQRKLEKLRAEPKHEFSDKQYDEERSQLIDKVHDAVEYGFSSLLPSVSSEPSTSKNAESKKPVKKKPKKRGFMFEDEDFSLSESDEETSSAVQSPAMKRLLESNENSECLSPKKQKTSPTPDMEEGKSKECSRDSECSSSKEQVAMTIPDTEVVQSLECSENGHCSTGKIQEMAPVPDSEKVESSVSSEDSIRVQK